MSAVSSLGIGSNLDLTTLLANIKSGEQVPLVALQKQQTSYTAKLTAYGQLSSALSALQTAAEALAKPALFAGVKASSSATDVLTATATSSATSGVYAVNVTQLSQAQSLATIGVASTAAAIGGGKVTIEFGTICTAPPDPVTGVYTLATPDPINGTYSGATFTADSTRTHSITIGSGSSLADIRDAINGDASLGVTASIVSDGSSTPNRLVLTSKQAGETSSMRISVTDQAAVAADPGPPEVLPVDAVLADTALVNLLTNNPESLVLTDQLQQTVIAQNTKLTVNGVPITSATNTVAGSVQDVTMTVTKAGSSTLTVQNDTGSVQSAITTFVSAYNSLQSIASKLTAFDAANRSGAILLGDSVLRNIQVGIRSTLTGAQADDDSGLTMLSQIGVSFQKDGTLAVESTKLTVTLGSKLSGVASLFSGSAGVGSARVGGYGTQLAALITGYTETDGTLSSATKGINSSLDMLSKRYTAATERIDATVARYKAQFTQLDLMMSRMTATSTYLTQQFDALNNTSKN